MVDFLKQIDTSLFLWLNGKHNYFFDVLMFTVTNKYTWIPFYLLLLWIIAKKFGPSFFSIFISVVITIALSDQLSVHLFKNVFLRYRPCHNPDIKAQIHLLGNCGGMYGFVSSHAANTFALATFLAFLFRSKTFTWFIFFWAALVSYSRIYTGVHYPADIFAGSLLGITISLLTYSLYKKLNKE